MAATVSPSVGVRPMPGGFGGGAIAGFLRAVFGGGRPRDRAQAHVLRSDRRGIRMRWRDRPRILLWRKPLGRRAGRRKGHPTPPGWVEAPPRRPTRIGECCRSCVPPRGSSAGKGARSCRSVQTNPAVAAKFNNGSLSIPRMRRLRRSAWARSPVPVPSCIVWMAIVR